MMRVGKIKRNPIYCIDLSKHLLKSKLEDNVTVVNQKLHKFLLLDNCSILLDI